MTAAGLIAPEDCSRDFIASWRDTSQDKAGEITELAERGHGDRRVDGALDPLGPW